MGRWECFGAEGCNVPEKLGVEACELLGQLGVRPCSGLVPAPCSAADKTPLCPTPTDLALGLMPIHPHVPPDMLVDGVMGIVDGNIGFADLPPSNLDPKGAVRDWGALMVRIEGANMPGRQQH